MRLLRVGSTGLLAEVDSVEAAVALYRSIRVAQQDGAAELAAVEVVPAARTVLLEGLTDVAGAMRVLAALDPTPAAGGAAPSVEIPTVYDGPDLELVARRWGMTRAEVVATHTGIEFVVAFCGFAPGFAYCTGLPADLEVPRLPSPRTRVPAGSVAVAGMFTGIYPVASPGGWLLLGTTTVVLWDEAADDPALLSPGARVRFVESR